MKRGAQLAIATQKNAHAGSEGLVTQRESRDVALSA